MSKSRLFSTLFQRFRQPRCDFVNHPANGVLRRYVDDKLQDVWPPDTLEEGCLSSTTLSDVSLHVARCRRCSDVVARLRYPERPACCDDGQRICANGWMGQSVGLWVSAYAIVILVFLSLSWGESPDTRRVVTPPDHYIVQLTLQPGESVVLIDYTDYLSGHSLMARFRARTEGGFYPSLRAF